GDLGQKCHEDMTRYVLSSQQFKQDRVLIWKRTQTGHSNDVTNPPIESPTQRPYEKYLTNCAKKLYPFCGNEIFFKAFFANQTVSDTCCVNLEGDLGQKCHEDMTRYVLSSQQFKQDRVLIWKRSKDVWNDCVSRLLLDIISPAEAPYYF
ncbi:hypothetical protein RYX36_018389, partial [Vicia faba]